MPNIASALKQEIARVARKVAKPDSEVLKRQVAQQRSAVAALKRRIGALEQLVARATKSGRGAARNVVHDVSEEAQSERHRFSAKGFANLRQRFGISAAAMGQLLGVSALSVYKWESGKTRPRAQQVEKIAAVRGLGKREVAARLGQEGETGAPSASGKQAGAEVAAAERPTRSNTVPGGKSRKVRRTAAKKSARKGRAVTNRTSTKTAAKRAAA